MSSVYSQCGSNLGLVRGKCAVVDNQSIVVPDRDGTTSKGAVAAEETLSQRDVYIVDGMGAGVDSETAPIAFGPVAHESTTVDCEDLVL